MKTHDMKQRSPEWFHRRKGKITGTGLAKVMGTSAARKKYRYELLAERLSTRTENGEWEDPRERGMRLEPEAIAAFELETGKIVSTVGFCEDDEDPMMANSPDGLVLKEKAAVEAKCPGEENHVTTWRENEIPKEYRWQLIQYFVINPELRRVYYVSYNPDIPRHPLHIIILDRKDCLKDIELARTAQKEILKEVNEDLKKIIKL